MATSFYKDLFTTQEQLEVDAILQHVRQRVTEEMNTFLTRPYKAEEIRKAIFMMGPNKSPGHDSMFLPVALGFGGTACLRGSAKFLEWR